MMPRRGKGQGLMEQGEHFVPLVALVLDGEVGRGFARLRIHYACTHGVGHVDGHDGGYAVVLSKQCLGGCRSHGEDHVHGRVGHEPGGLTPVVGV
jgi:hypothetical protein